LKFILEESNCLATPKRIEKQIRLQQIAIQFENIEVGSFLFFCLHGYVNISDYQTIRGESVDVFSLEEDSSCFVLVIGYLGSVIL
jgi:hypothetical protein